MESNRPGWSGHRAWCLSDDTGIDGGFGCFLFIEPRKAGLSERACGEERRNWEEVDIIERQNSIVSRMSEW